MSGGQSTVGRDAGEGGSSVTSGARAVAVTLVDGTVSGTRGRGVVVVDGWLWGFVEEGDTEYSH